VIFAIEAADTGFGPGLTAAVEAAAARVADEIVAEVTVSLRALSARAGVA